MAMTCPGGAGGDAGNYADNPLPSTSQQEHQEQQQQQQQQQQRQQSETEPTNQRFSNLIHDSEVFLTKLREFKPQSLGCLEARRKSSSTLIFPSPQQACMGPPKCPRYPHNVKPTPGYWIECHGPGVLAVGGGKAAGAQTSASSAIIHSGAAAAGASQQTDQQQQRGLHARSSQDETCCLLDAGSRSSPFASVSEHQNLSSICSDTTAVQQQQQSSSIPPTQRKAASFCREKEDWALKQADQEQQADVATVHDVFKRRQSIGGDQPSSTTASPEMSLQQQQSTAENNSGTLAAADKSMNHSNQINSSKQFGAYESSQERRQVALSSSQQRPTGAAAAGGGGGAGSSRRKQLNKRTMTRDDIDLHKTRRGTPNITITEPSFNQSTTTATAALLANQRISLARQASNKQLKQVCSIEASPPVVDEVLLQKQPRQTPPVKVCELEQELEQGREKEEKEQAKSDFNSRASIEFKSLERQDSGSAGKGASADYTSSGAQEPPLYRDFQHHRPSVIREDIDNESSADDGGDQRDQNQSQKVSTDTTGLVTTGIESTEARPGQDQAGKQLYCGLSTTEFTKRPYQAQAYSEQQSFDQFRDSSLELISFEEENYEKHYYGREHWNYFTNDELLGPVMLSLKQEVNNQRDHFHVLLRTVSYTLHGTIPASTICADRYDREAIVRELSEIAKLKPALMLGQLPSTPDELLKLDHIFIKTELKVGVIYIKSGQEESEEAILGNREESPLFIEFLDLLGDRITLRGFDRYKGGLDTVHNLTGTESVYTMWRNIEIMFHVSTMLPHEENDPQKLQKKRHIGNDIVCVAFIESDDTLFWPGCVKSYFLHTFIAVRTSPRALKEGEKRKYSVSCVCRNEVQYAFRPYLVEQDEFFKSDYFREWLLVKIVNGERASYSAPKFARMQDRTRSQLLEDIITNLANHLVTGQIPKPYRRGSWRPLGHTRVSSPLEDSMKDYFEDSDQLAKDFCNAFCGLNKSVLCDVVFKVKDADGSFKLVHGVRAIMAIRSRTFLEMLYGFAPPGAGPSGLQNQTNLRAIEMKALSGESSASTSGGKDTDNTKSLLTKRGSVGTDSSRKTGEKERRQSMLPNISKSTTQKHNYLTVPNTSGGAGASAGGSTGGMIKNAFNRLVSGNWSGWSGNIKGYKGEPMHIKVDQNKTKVDLNSLAICKEIAKIDADKLTRREFEIKEFDYETFQQTIEYIHNGQCKLSYETIPGLICAAEHYDLPDLLHACFHHANTHMKLGAAPRMMNSLYQNSCFYITAMQLLDSIYEFIDPHGNEFFNRSEYLELYESVFTSLLCRKSLQVTELKKFQAMDGWARQQVANKQQKQLLQRKQSSENQEKQQQQQQQQSSSDQYVAQEQQQQQQQQTVIVEQKVMSREEAEQEYRNLMNRLNREINIKLDKISSEDLVKVVLPTKVFSNDKIFEVMVDETRNDY